MNWLDRICPQLHVVGGRRQDWRWRDPLRILHDHELLFFGRGFVGQVAWEGGSVTIAGDDWVLIPPGLAHTCEGGGPGSPWRLWVHFDWDHRVGRGLPEPLITYAPSALRQELVRPAPSWVPISGVGQGSVAGFAGLRDLHGRLAAAWNGGKQHHRAAARGLLLELLARVLVPEHRSEGDSRHQLAHRVREVLDDLAHQPFARSDALPTGLARLGRSADHCAKVFRSVFGVPPARYLAAQRISQAEELLAEGRPPAEVARRLGFTDAGYFNRMFRRVTGTPPGRWQSGRRSS